MRTFIALIGLIIGLGCLASISAYAIGAFEWWLPIAGTNKEERGFLLLFLHIVALVVGIFSAMGLWMLYDEKSL